MRGLEILPLAAANGVTVMPGVAFYSAAGGEHALRLGYAFCPPEQLAQGVKRIGQAIEAYQELEPAA